MHLRQPSHIAEQSRGVRRILMLMVITVGLMGTAFSQLDNKVRLYQPSENAEEILSKKIREAKESNRHVLIQVGNNGCVWCYRFHDFVKGQRSIDSVLRKNYVMYHLNTSPENANEKLLAKYGYPQRFGYPVFLVLNSKGSLIHTQNSVYLEQGIGYNKDRVIEFLEQWSPAAIHPSRYKQQ